MHPGSVQTLRQSHGFWAAPPCTAQRDRGSAQEKPPAIWKAKSGTCKRERALICFIWILKESVNMYYSYMYCNHHTLFKDIFFEVNDWNVESPVTNADTCQQLPCFRQGICADTWWPLAITPSGNYSTYIWIVTPSRIMQVKKTISWGSLAQKLEPVRPA